MSFSRKVKGLCGERGAQARLIEATGLSQFTINRIVNGNQEPSLLQAVAIARALGASLDELTDDEMVEVEALNTLTDADRKVLDWVEVIGHDEALRRLALAPPRPTTVDQGEHPRPPVDQMPQTEPNTLADDMAAETAKREREREREGKRRPAG